MSCFVMNPESLATIAGFTADLLDQAKYHNNTFGISPPCDLTQRFTELGAYNKRDGVFSAGAIYVMLYKLNFEAFHNCYNGRHDEDYPAAAPNLKIHEHRIHKPFVYLERGKYQVQGWEPTMAGLIDTWLYQTCERGTKDSPLRNAMQQLNSRIYAFIVQNHPSYAWG